MNWNILKEEVLENINKAEITNKKAIQTILRFERRINTTRNKLDSGMSFYNVCHEDSYNQAGTILTYEFGSNGYKDKEAPFYNEFVKYCKACGYCSDGNLGDWLA